MLLSASFDFDFVRLFIRRSRGGKALSLIHIFGIGFSKLFQMLLMNLSEISVDIRFSISIKPVAVTALVFLVIFGMMIAKGYYSIKKSSVLDMLSGARQKEMKPENIWLTLVRVVPVSYTHLL